MSDTDENLPSTSKKKDKQEYYKSIFDKHDKKNTGFIELAELQKCDDEVSKHIIKNMSEMSPSDHDGKINFHEYMGIIQNKRFVDLFTDYINTYKNFIVPQQQLYPLVADGLSREYAKVKQKYEKEFTCCPLPFAMIIISITELVCFIIDKLTERDSKIDSGITAHIFIYDPHNRKECWRFFTYIFVHNGYVQLVVNLAVQLLLGIPLEMVNKWWRVLLIYFAGVVAGSLGSSIADPHSYLAGASGGVYALIFAHLGTILLNWNEMIYPFFQPLIFLIIVAVDMGTAIYNRYWPKLDEHISYAGHISGAMAGILGGITILRVFIPKRTIYLWRFALIIYLLLIVIAIVLNIVLTDHFY